MSWPPLDDETHLWLCQRVAAPALRQTAEEFASLPGCREVACVLEETAAGLESAPTSAAGALIGMETTGGLPQIIAQIHLDAWGKQLYRQVVRLLVAVSQVPGRGISLATTEQAWVWAARLVQGKVHEVAETDRVAIMLLAGIVMDHGAPLGR